MSRTLEYWQYYWRSEGSLEIMPSNDLKEDIDPVISAKILNKNFQHNYYQR